MCKCKKGGGVTINVINSGNRHIGGRRGLGGLGRSRMNLLRALSQLGGGHGCGCCSGGHRLLAGNPGFGTAASHPWAPGNFQMAGNFQLAGSFLGLG